MFKRHVVGQRISPSEPAALSMALAPAPMTISADLDYLHHMSDDEREAYDKGRPPPIQYPGPPGFKAVGYMFRRLSLRR